jgi:hypothetical protein
MGQLINMMEKKKEINENRRREFQEINEIFENIDTDAIMRAIYGSPDSDGNIDNTLLNKSDAKQFDQWYEAIERSSALRK